MQVPYEIHDESHPGAPVSTGADRALRLGGLAPPDRHAPHQACATVSLPPGAAS